MSLRGRLLLVVMLAALALAASLFAILQLRAQGARARETAAFEQGSRVVDALTQRLGTSFSEQALAHLDPPQRAALRTFQQSLITPLVDASTGFCLPGGSVAAVETTALLAFGPDGNGGDRALDAKLHRPVRLLPLDQRVVERTCRELRDDAVGHTRFAAPNDVLFISARRLHGAFAAFALVRMPNRSKEERSLAWPATISLIFVCVLLLVVVTVSALMALRQDTSQLENALMRLAHDLRTSIHVPRLAELSRIADALRRMASELATIRERERGLESRLAQEKQLAGLGRVVAGVAHEVRNPLAGMKLKLDLLLRRDVGYEVRQDIAVCLSEIARLDRVVGGILLVSRQEPLMCSRCSLGRLVRERALAAQEIALHRGVRIEVEGDADALAHRDSLVRIVDNLLRNALEASPRDTAVSLVTSVTDGTVALTVIDAGAGVPTEHEARLFEPFFTLKPEGTGLGLFLSRSLAVRQGGRLSYLRTRQQTRFLLTLPTG